MRIAGKRSARWLLAAAVLAAWVARAQSPPAAAGNYRIAGRVVNAATGDPVAHAIVTVLTEEDDRLVASVLSDGEGNFAISGLPAGKFPLTAARRGFRTAYYDEHEESFNTAIVTGPDQDTEHLLFKLQPGAVIYGTISSDGGDPVQNANVMLFRRNSAAPSRNPVTVGGTGTDDTGAYEFSDLAPGDYYIAVGAQPWYAIHGPANGESSAGNELDVAYPVTFFDSTTDEASATALSVAAGSRTEANISLHAVPALRIRLTGPRAVGGGPNIELRQTVFGAELPAQVDLEGSENGSREIVGLAPGRYELSSNDPPRVQEVNAASSMDIDPSTGIPSQPVDGTVRMADGSAVGNVMLTLLPSTNNGESVQVNAETHNGRFHVDAVPPGEWSISAGGEGFPSARLFVDAVSAAGGGAAGNQITVRDHPLTIAVTLSRSQARVDGFARAGDKPASGAMIVLVPSDPAAYSSLVRRDQSDSDGSFSLPDIAPGRYIVVALVDGWNLNWQDRAVITRYLPRGEPVTIEGAGAIRLPRPVQAVSP